MASRAAQWHIACRGESLEHVLAGTGAVDYITTSPPDLVDGHRIIIAIQPPDTDYPTSFAELEPCTAGVLAVEIWHLLSDRDRERALEDHAHMKPDAAEDREVWS